MPIRDRQPSDCVDVAGQCQFKLALDEIPELNRPVSRPSGKELVERIYGYRADPACVSSYDALELPGCVPLDFSQSLVSEGQGMLVLVEGMG